ncbi:MAG: hypothetical protein ACP5I4_03130 [Oceanipulchritudo sp.]
MRLRKTLRTKHLTLAAAAAAFGFFMGTAHGQTTVLVSPATNNGGFEDSTTDILPWEDSTPQGTFTVDSTTYAKSGLNSLIMTSTGSWSVPVIFQEFDAAEGEVWEVNGFMLAPTALTANYAGYKIVWFDAAGEIDPLTTDPELIGNPLTGSNPGIESVPFLDSGIAAETWHEMTARGTAPPGTVKVQILALYLDPSGSSEGPVHVDDVTITKTEAAAPPFPVDVAVNGADLELTFDTTYGFDYTALTSSGLSGFVSVPDVLVGGSGDPKTMVIPGAAPASGEKSFYLVESNPLTRPAAAAGEILVNGTLDSGLPAECPNTSGWEAYATFTKAGEGDINSAWGICDAPFVVTTPGTATFGMNDQLALDDPNYAGADQVVTVYQNFWAPENSLGIRPTVNLRGKSLTFTGNVNDTLEPFASGNKGEVVVQLLGLSFNIATEKAVDINVDDTDFSDGTLMDTTTGDFTIAVNVGDINLNAVRVGFRNTGIEGTAGEMVITNLSAVANRTIDFPGLTGEVIRNGDFSEGLGGLDEWELFASWTGGAIPFADGPVSNLGNGVVRFGVNATNSGEASFQQNFFTPDNSDGVSPTYNLYGQVLTLTGEVDVTEAYSGGNVGQIGVQFLTSPNYGVGAETIYISDISVVDTDGSDGTIMNADGTFSITVTAPSAGLNIIQIVFRNLINTPTSLGGTGEMTINGPISLIAADPAP